MRLQIVLATGIVLLCAAVGVALYYGLEVRAARRDTAALVSAAWQRYGKRVSLAELSPTREALLLAVEDPTFYRHHGVDLETPGAGMTTITQALVKLLYFPEGFKPGIKKIRQTLIAQYALDDLVPKAEQLELFLNIASLGAHAGREIRGFDAGARAYFDRPFAALDDTQFKALVAMLPGPYYFIPGSAAHTERMQRIDKFLAGELRPASLLDVEYNGKRSGGAAEEALMSALRLATDAAPSRSQRARSSSRAAEHK